jgi:hypothetical protein
MPVLANARHEQFAQRVASGSSLLEAYTSTGYSEAGAQSSASRLARNAKVRARIAELKAEIAGKATTRAAFDKERVLTRLDLLGRLAEGDGKWSAAIYAEELIGKERGMFGEKIEHAFKWSGRIEDLNDVQLEAYHQSIAQHYGLSTEDLLLGAGPAQPGNGKE